MSPMLYDVSTHELPETGEIFYMAEEVDEILKALAEIIDHPDPSSGDMSTWDLTQQVNEYQTRSTKAKVLMVKWGIKK